MGDRKVIIAGAGIAGLSFALTLHQIGVDCVVYETVRQLKPLGVGINIQPNAVRELYDLGFTSSDLDGIGIATKEWALVGKNGQEIYAEPRGLMAGYKWPQYSVHRGELQMALYRRFTDLAGPDAVQLGCRVVGYDIKSDGSVSVNIKTPTGDLEDAGALLVGADGIHSAVRAQMHSDQPDIHWGGAIMWRGTSLMKPVRTGSSFIGLGDDKQRMVIYPISQPDRNNGLALTNWIAEVTYDDPAGYKNTGWFSQVTTDKFIHHFEDWTYDWIDIPGLIGGADVAFENPMIDRDPISTWVDGPVALMGDAAHPMYPTGSNGASQAIVDARILGASFLARGVNAAALVAYDDRLCKPISQVVLRNREAGPFGLLKLVDERSGGEFDSIDDVISHDERLAFMADYKAAAGFAQDALNSAGPTVPKGARVRSAT